MHTSLPGNTHNHASDHVGRGISIITHLEFNNPKVYLSPVGNETEMFPLALASRIWTVFNVNKITRYQNVLVFPQQSAPSQWTQRFPLIQGTVEQMLLQLP